MPVTLYKNPYAGIQAEVDQDGMPWWPEAEAEAEAEVEPAWGDCPVCGAETFLGWCSYCADH